MLRSLIRRVFLVYLVLFSMQVSASNIRLGVGQQEILTFDTIAKSVSVDRSGIVNVSKGESKSVIIVTGKGEGSTNLVVRLDDGRSIEYQVDVSPSARSQFSAALDRLRRMPGIVVEAKGGKYQISGQFRNRNDLQSFLDIRKRFADMIIDATDPEVVESNAVIRTINRVLAENDIANIQAHGYGQIIALEGSPKNEAQKNLALRIARMISPGVEDHISMDSNGAPPISIEVLFIEATKTNNKTYGIRGPQDAFAGRPINQSGLFKGSTDGISSTKKSGKFDLLWQVGSLSAFLRLEQTKGSSRIVSNPKLVARSGQKAVFESGGAFYIPNVTQGTDGVRLQTFSQEQTGIILSIEPRIDAIGQIDSKIKTSIIELGEKFDGERPPSLIRSNLETAVTIRNGESLLLSGLTLKKARKNVSRVPLLADIPIIGELFKERTQQFEEKEVAIIVTMNRVQSSENRSPIVDQLLQTSDSEISFSIFD